MSKLYHPFQPILTDTGLERFGLGLDYRPACDILGDVVHFYLQISTAKPTPYHVIPDATQAIFISSEGSIIGGAQLQARDIQILQPGEYFGIWFYPGAIRYFFDLDIFEITDQYVDNQYFPCRDFAQLHEKIYQYKSFQQRARVCEQWLLQHFRPGLATSFDHALSLVYQSSGNIKINKLANMVGWSSRHLNRQFRSHTGLSTKSFAQTIRIQHACKRLCYSPDDSLKTALELGFFDQAHLLNDYKKRLLSSPGVVFDRFKSDFYNS